MMHQRETFTILWVLVISAGMAGGVLKDKSTGKGLRVGDTAPDFSLPYATKEKIELFQPWKLSEHLGQKAIVLAFYPADWSPGCTKEVCTFRDNFSALVELDAYVVGISGDYVFSHHEWAKNQSLPFPLLSDHDHKVARLYQSYDEKMGYNKRTVFIVDKKGKIRYMNLAYSVADDRDFETLKDALKKLTS